jgi:diacylglycerol O-acyltransferase-1
MEVPDKALCIYNNMSSMYSNVCRLNVEVRFIRLAKCLQSSDPLEILVLPGAKLLSGPLSTPLMFCALLLIQVNFPRTERIRKRWLLRRLAELAVFLGLLLFMANQYLAPAITNSISPLNESDWIRVVERVLKLALPTLYCWLAMFYCLFHLWLNILAELTRFGDREFYKDWWNAATIGDYWKLWNMPVHKWLLRTVYFPAMRAGVGR